MDVTDLRVNRIINAVIPAFCRRLPNSEEEKADVTLQGNLKALDCQLKQVKREYKDKTFTIVTENKKKLREVIDNFARQGEVINAASKTIETAANKEESRTKRLRIDWEAKQNADEKLLKNCKNVLSRRHQLIKSCNEFLRREIPEYGSDSELSENESK